MQRSANVLACLCSEMGATPLHAGSPTEARSDDEVLDLGEDRLDAFATLFVYRLADVAAAGFEVVPTYRSPHVTIRFYDDVDTGVARLLAVSHRILSNPALRQEGA